MGYNIVQADVDRDKQAILAFWNLHHAEPLDPKFEWIYEGNPAGKALVFLAEHSETGEIVGCVSLFPQRFAENGTPVLYGNAGDFFVVPKHRTALPAIKLQKSLISAAESGLVEFVYVFGSRKGEPIIGRAGYRRLASKARMVKVLKTSRFLSQRGVPPSAVRIAGPVIDFILRLVSYDTWCRIGDDDRFEEVSDPGPEFDRLLSRVVDNHRILVERSADYLRWKYLEDPDDENRIYALFSKDRSAIRGYAVYRLGGRAMDIRDIIALDEGSLKTLLGCLVRHARSMDLESVVLNYMQNDRITMVLNGVGFRPGKIEGSVFGYAADCDDGGSGASYRADDWLLMLSDRDT